MILDFNGYIINEASLKKLKREVHGALNMSARKRMRRELRDNIITFKFKKRNGDIRTAHGTLHPDYLPPLKGGGPRPEHQMVYYDLDKEGWRSFRSYTFIKILNIKPVEAKPVTKPHPKPITKEEDEEEVKKKPIHTEDEEKAKEKEEKVKEKEEKKKIHEIDDEIEDDDDHKSVLDDKETPEEKEVIRKDKEKDEEKDEEEDEEKEKEKDKDIKSEDE